MRNSSIMQIMKANNEKFKLEKKFIVLSALIGYVLIVGITTENMLIDCIFPVII